VITNKAAATLLAALAAEDAELHCYCTDPECDSGRNHPADDGRPPPQFGYAYVTAGGGLDRAANREAYGTDHGALKDDIADVLDELTNFAAYIDDVVVIDRTTGCWWTGAEFRDTYC
jgi:hypothetical protein